MVFVLLKQVVNMFRCSGKLIYFTHIAYRSLAMKLSDVWWWGTNKSGPIGKKNGKYVGNVNNCNCVFDKVSRITLCYHLVLFYFRLDNKTLECCDYSGENRRIIYRLEMNPGYIALCSDTLYYTIYDQKRYSFRTFISLIIS